MDISQDQTRTTAERPTPSGALEHWGPFTHLARVGQGSFGEVYRAFDATLQRHVALKLLIPRGLQRNVEIDALLREARALARVRHPNVVPVYGVNRYEGRIGFWTDFVQGKTLTELIAAQGPFGSHEAALIGIDVCRAVGAVHAAGLLHRDIKAGNVMREEGGRILLMDFGLTHKSGTEDYPSGTPAYMAPELLQGLPATIASDVYAIGVLLFHLLTTQYPVEGSDFGELLAAHAAGNHRTLLDVRPDVPEALAQVIETAMIADPRSRFASTGRMVAALSNAIGFVPAADTSLRAARAWDGYLPITLWAAAVPLAITFLGFVTSLAFNVTLGRYGPFAAESALSWPVWGVRSLVSPGVIAIFLLLTSSLIQSVFRMTCRFVPQVRALAARTRSAFTPVATSLGFFDPDVMATLLAVCGGLALAGVLWWYADIWTAVTSYITSAPASVLHPLQPSNQPAYLQLRVVMSTIDSLVAFGLLRVIRLRRLQTPPRRAMPLVVSLLTLSVGLVVVVLPWRLLTQDKFERIDVGGSRCYEIGRDGDRLLLYCPEADPPRNRVMMRSDRTLRPTGIIESIFTAP